MAEKPSPMKQPPLPPFPTEPMGAPPPPEVSADTLGSFLAEGFDQAGFAEAIRRDDLFSAQEKEAITAYFTPSQPVEIFHDYAGDYPEALIEPAAYAPPGDPLAMPHRRPLIGHAHIHDMWQDVWRESLHHYRDEIGDYRNAMAGRVDDQPSYPQELPELVHEKGTPEINACTMIPKDKVKVVVSDGFLERYNGREQRAILLHEARHALAPALEGKSLMEWSVNATKRTSAQHQAEEFTADAHAARLGEAVPLQSALLTQEQEWMSVALKHHHVRSHLGNHGFAFSPDAVASVLAVEAPPEKGAYSPDDFGFAFAGAGERLNADTVRDNTLQANRRIAEAAEQSRQQPLPAIIETLRASLHTPDGTHPPTQDRVAALTRQGGQDKPGHAR